MIINLWRCSALKAQNGKLIPQTQVSKLHSTMQQHENKKKQKRVMSPTTVWYFPVILRVILLMDKKK